MPTQTIELVVQIATASAATFFAIMLWPKTHDAAWMLVIVGLVLNYIAVIYGALETLGLSHFDTGLPWLNLSINLLVRNAPYICIAIGLFIAYREKTKI